MTTPEKWDGVSRGWQSRKYVQAVGLVVIDEIHLLGEVRWAKGLGARLGIGTDAGRGRRTEGPCWR